MRRLNRFPTWQLVLLVAALATVFVAPTAVAARPTQVAGVDVDQIVGSIERSGRFVDPALAAAERGPDVESAIDRANAADIAVIITTGDADVAALVGEVVDRLVAEDADLTSVLAFDDVAIEADIEAASVADIDRGIAGFNAGFETGGNAAAIDGFVAEVTGATVGSTATTQRADTGESSGAGNGSDSGGGVPWLALILFAVLGFVAFRFFAGRRKRRAAEQAEIELDRTEIREQLRSNADRVIDLGDPVIASRDPELISLYEEASTTYQEVSLGLAEATTAAEIDSLDDRIDRAEWQLAVIEARLAGKPDPRSPDEVARDSAPPPPSDRPALGRDESVFDGQPDRSGPTKRGVPAPSRRSNQRQDLPSGGSPGGGLGGGLSNILIGILLGQAGRPRSVSRRSRQRWSQPRPASSGRASSGVSLPGPVSPSTRRGGGSGLGSPWGRSRSGGSRTGGSRTGRSRSGGRRTGNTRGRSGGRR